MMIKKQYLLGLILIIIGIVISGCFSDYKDIIKSQKENPCHFALTDIFKNPEQCDCCSFDDNTICPPKNVPFLGDQDDYYRCALSHIQCGSYEKALHYLNLALCQRDEESRMAYVYGMHHTSYFPYREKGIVLYHLGKYEAAYEALNKSFSKIPTDKAKFYMDKVRQKILISKKKHSVPVIDTKTNLIFSNKDSIMLSGKATDHNYISTITLENADLFSSGRYDVYISQAKTEIPFNLEISPEEGVYHINVKAINLIGEETVKQITLHMDRSGPVITIVSANKETGVIGILSDASQSITWCVNDGQRQQTDRNQATFHIRPDNKGQLILKAWDRLGNETQADLSLLLASNDQDHMNLIASRSPPIICDLTPHLALQSLTSGPLISIKEFPDKESVWLNEIKVEGFVQSIHPIVSVSIDGQKIHIQKRGIRHDFCKSVLLSSEKKEILIEAVNDHHQISQKFISCLKKTRQIDQPKNNYTLTLKKISKVIPESFHLKDSLENIIYKNLADSNRFYILNNEKIVSMAGVKAYINVVSMKNNMIEIELTTRFSINLPDEGVHFFDAYDLCQSSKFDETFKALSTRLNNSILNYFNRVRGEIVDITNNILTVKYNASHGIPNYNLPLYIVRKKAMKSQKTGLNLGYDYIIILEALPYSIDFERNLLKIKDSSGKATIDDMIIGR